MYVLDMQQVSTIAELCFSLYLTPTVCMYVCNIDQPQEAAW